MAMNVEGWVRIFAFLDVANLLKCKQVCKFFRDIIRIHATILPRIAHKQIEMNLHTPFELKAILDLNSESPIQDIQNLFIPSRPRRRYVSKRLRFYKDINILRLSNILVHMNVKSIVILNYQGPPFIRCSANSQTFLWRQNTSHLESATFSAELEPDSHSEEGWNVFSRKEGGVLQH